MEPRVESIAIDGPAGAGKSSVARRVAAELGCDYIDTGAMYRAVTLTLLHAGLLLEPVDLGAIDQRLAELELTVGARGDLWLDGEEVSHQLRSEEVTQRVSFVSSLASVRQRMVDLQRRVERGLRSAGRGVVMDGRDIGSNVLPHAEHRFYLDASVEERARRRRDQCRADPRTDPALMDLDLEEWAARLRRRDQLDSERSLDPLRIPAGATLIDSTQLDEDQVVERILREVRGRTVR